MQSITLKGCGKCTGQSCTEPPISMVATENERANAKVFSLTDACQLTERYADDPGFVILDLRSPADFIAGHLTGAVNLEYVSPPSFEEAVKNMDRNKRYLVYCYGGGMSAEAAFLMEEMGFRKIYDMTQGLNSWRAAECPLDNSLAA